MSSRNTLCWMDIPVVDLDRSIAFYSAVLDSDVTRETSHGMDFGLLPHADNNVSGCLVKMDDNRPSETGPLVYLSVKGRMDPALKAVVAFGGRITVDKHPIGPFGFRAIIIDSEGNRIALHSTVE